MTRRAAFAAGVLLSASILGGGFVLYKRLAVRYSPETYQLGDDILVHGNVDLKEVALTFDDGPRPETTRPLLDVLGKAGVKATFFVVGVKVNENPGLVRRMMNEGHEVANHSNTHPRLDGLSDEEIRREIAECGHAVKSASGANMTLFRPPGMRYDNVVIRTAQDLGYVTVHWNSAAQDFQPQNPKRTVEKILQQTRPGSVILLHAHPNTVEALPEILRGLKAKGYRFVRVSQMLARLPRPVIVATNAYGVKQELIANRSDRGPLPVRAASARPANARRESHVQPGKAGPPPKRGIDVPTWN